MKSEMGVETWLTGGLDSLASLDPKGRLKE